MNKRLSLTPLLPILDIPDLTPLLASPPVTKSRPPSSPKSTMLNVFPHAPPFPRLLLFRLRLFRSHSS
eukprot:32703-Rhodomonas_salina.1